MTIYCAHCEHTNDLPRSFVHHIRHHHNLTAQEYYDQQHGPGKCGTCDKPVTRFLGLTKGYQRYCSNKCFPRSDIVKANWDGNIERRSANSERVRQGTSLYRRKSRKGSPNKREYPRSEAVLERWLNNKPPCWKGKEHSELTKLKMSETRSARMQTGEIKLVGFHQGKFKPKHPEKYVGDPNNIIYRSGWEAKFFRYLDNHPDIVQWQSEEVVVPYFYPVDQKIHRYFPDVVVKKRNPDGSHAIIMIEIKPERETMPPKQTKNKTKRRMITEAATYIKNKSKWEAAKRYCKERGWTFQVLTEKHLGVLKG